MDTRDLQDIPQQRPLLRRRSRYPEIILSASSRPVKANGTELLTNGRDRVTMRNIRWRSRTARSRAQCPCASERGKSEKRQPEVDEATGSRGANQPRQACGPRGCLRCGNRWRRRHSPSEPHRKQEKPIGHAPQKSEAGHERNRKARRAHATISRPEAIRVQKILDSLSVPARSFDT
jgi:hypothetical protein